MKDYKLIRNQMFKTPRTSGDGPFEANDKSLSQYECPDWFRDAKFGIWAHWGPQGVPMNGDWYARNMYVEGSQVYNYHLAHYGHPSLFGFKDIIPLWVANKFDPDALMDKYVAAGAKYFVSLGVHVDNFDCWDSTYQRWNAVDMGPKQNIVGAWEKAAKARGLRFGVTEHLSNYYYWYGPSKLSDKSGTYKDVLYDGSDPDLSDLYFSSPHNSDTSVFNTPAITPNAWNHEWYHRMKDLIDQHDPDLFYIDGGIPFGHVGRQLMAYFYNHNIKTKGSLDGVFNIKNIKNLCEYVEGVGTLDFERGVANEITSEPWQIDTCVGNWFYETDYKYKTSQQVLEFLIDTVSKNGNLLLNIPLKPDGTLDEACNRILSDLAMWMNINSQGIYETRPWIRYGQNIRRKLKASESKNEDDFKMGEKELRFTRKDKTLFVFFFNWPKDSKIFVTDLEKHSKISSCILLGSNEKISINQVHDSVTFYLPDQHSLSQAYVLKVELT